MSKEITTKPHVLVNFLQDFSGSMEHGWFETASGFKTFVDMLKSKEDVEYVFSLTLFNTSVDKSIIGRPIASIDSGLLSGLRPTGGTALFDALAETINDTRKNALEADKVIFVVVTDGEENSSRVWTKEALHSLVDAELAAGKTTFQYLGTQPESWEGSAQIGIAMRDTVQYDANHTVAMYSCVGDALNNFAADKSLRSTRSMTQTYASESNIAAANLKFDPQV